MTRFIHVVHCHQNCRTVISHFHPQDCCDLRVGGWETAMKQQNSWARASTQTNPCVKHPGSKKCASPTLPPSDKGGKFLQFCELPQLPFPNHKPPGPPTDHNTHIFFLVETELRVCLCTKTACTFKSHTSTAKSQPNEAAMTLATVGTPVGQKR